MAMKELIIDVQLKDPNKVLDKIADLVSEYEELAELIPEWNNIEAKQHCDKIGELLSDLLETKKRRC